MEQINVAICYSESVKSVVWTCMIVTHVHPLYEYLSVMGWMECKKVLHNYIIFRCV